MQRTEKTKRLLSLLLCMMLMICIIALPALGAAEETQPDAQGTAHFSSEQVQQIMENAYEIYKEEAMEDPVRIKEVTPEDTEVSMYVADGFDTEDVTMQVCTIELDGHKMQYFMDIVGEPDENGSYPLYITLHGGGEDDEPEGNNDQWVQMRDYYKGSVKNGIYVATRGMEDVWNLHFLPESFPMYDRLIEDMILLKNADPNRVYLLGFSAGGDGVYGVAPKMADRFAAVNMSSGHPNGISLLNTSNLPFEIQVGIRDFYTETVLRSIRGAEFEDTLNGYHDKYGFGYPHRVLVHVPNGHNYNDCTGGAGDSCVLNDPAQFAHRAESEGWVQKFEDVSRECGGAGDVMGLSYEYADENYTEKLMKLITEDFGLEVNRDTDANAVTYVSSFTRNPMPEQLVWDLSTRADTRKDTSFYWLQADYSVNKGVITASYDKETNTVTVTPDADVNGDFSILVNPWLMDMSRTITVVTPEGQYSVDVIPHEDVITRSFEETGDLKLAYAATISYKELTGK